MDPPRYRWWRPQGTQPEAAAAALREVQGASKQALGELRRILNVLRQADDDDPTAPAPGLADLPGLVESTPIEVRVVETPSAVPGTVDVAAYRILQESLTNALRYAGKAPTRVTLRYTLASRSVSRWSTRGTGVPPPPCRAPARVDGHAGAGRGGRGNRRGRSRSGRRVRGARRAPTGGTVIRVLLADDQVLVCGGFRAILDSAEDITVGAEAGDGTEAVRQTEQHRPDVVLMDIRMPGTDGLATTTICRSHYADRPPSAHQGRVSASRIVCRACSGTFVRI